MNLSIPGFDELPVDASAKKESVARNKLQVIFIMLLNQKGVLLSDVSRATGIPLSTLQDWYKGQSDYHFADIRLLKLARYFNVSMEYLLFGIHPGEEIEHLMNLAN